MRPLSLCKQGQRVIIKRVIGSGAFRKRLLEMGFIRESEATIIRYAPLRDPMQLNIKDTHVSLRVCEAEKIEVEPVDFEESRTTPEAAV